ncbi:M14 family metallopeptidase [Pseudoalteromonas sp. MMG012]|uniref:M14 family metallopeptidase n=1 Tax=Pseudoalteromonas sp. MMG012 TaxID=2822686 RepID=UPI001B3A1779|nr:M14 family metallopeptidase [Pseudoalteromonas sp. MMG012]MBQ4848870.1 M14 family metallopeptidase [Pseudoalteromonas sp. MMG012]
MIASIIMLSAAMNLDAHLPPLETWQGQSLQLIQQKGPLTTDFELSGGVTSPDYQLTMAFVDRLVAANPTQFKAISIGQSQAGRDIKMLVASEQGTFSATEISTSAKPTLLIQAGIHAGEIDGKDAGFMLLRDIATGKRLDILEKINILFVPILNVDGHERRSPFNRINQRGPIDMGFRTNGNNLNINRDYTKLDTPEVRAVLQVIKAFDPDLYIDVHVTDGADYQYDVTYGYNPQFASESPLVAKVLDTHFKPQIDAALTQAGHIAGPLVFVMDKQDFKQGLAGWVATPRFSNGWGDLASVPTILVENHSLKPYKQRVLGTYVFFDGVVDALAKGHSALEKAIDIEHATRPKEIVVRRSYAKQPDHIPFRGIAYKQFDSALSGQVEVKYLGQPKFYDALPIYWQKTVEKKVKVPAAFYIPPAYPNIVEKLRIHGISVEIVSTAESKGGLKQAKITQYEFAKLPFEGRFRVTAEFDLNEVEKMPLTGWYRISTDQAKSELVTHLLHPEAPDSFFQWGEFNTIFQRTEYVENYALEPYARSMLKSNPAMALEFDKKIREDESFANDAKKRLSWLYEKTPFYDQAYLKYPVLIELGE